MRRVILALTAVCLMAAGVGCCGCGGGGCRPSCASNYGTPSYSPMASAAPSYAPIASASPSCSTCGQY